MKRLHVHVSVDRLADSIRFYSTMFAAEPTVRKDDYAKWMLDDPRVNFSISQRGAAAGLNHLGIQVESGTELAEMESRLNALQPALAKEEGVACCYAKSDKYWVTDPSGIAWETFHTLDSVPIWGEQTKTGQGAAQSGCCTPVEAAIQPAKREPASQTCMPTPGKQSAAGRCC